MPTASHAAHQSVRLASTLTVNPARLPMVLEHYGISPMVVRKEKRTYRFVSQADLERLKAELGGPAVRLRTLGLDRTGQRRIAQLGLVRRHAPGLKKVGFRADEVNSTLADLKRYASEGPPPVGHFALNSPCLWHRHTHLAICEIWFRIRNGEYPLWRLAEGNSLAAFAAGPEVLQDLQDLSDALRYDTRS